MIAVEMSEKSKDMRPLAAGGGEFTQPILHLFDMFVVVMYRAGQKNGP